MRENLIQSGIRNMIIVSVSLFLGGCTIVRQGPLTIFDEPVEAEASTVRCAPLNVVKTEVSVSEYKPTDPPKLQLRLEVEEPKYEMRLHERYESMKVVTIKYASFTGSAVERSNDPSLDFLTGFVSFYSALLIGPVIDLSMMPICAAKGDFGGGGNGVWVPKSHEVVQGPKMNSATYLKETRLPLGDEYDLSAPLSLAVDGKQYSMKTNWIILRWNERWWETLEGKDNLVVKFPFEDQPRNVSLKPAWDAYADYLASKSGYEQELLEERLKN